jgi:hypothetical protein
MKIIFRGGYNSSNYESLQNSLLLERGFELSRELEKGKRVVVVTAAKPDGAYDCMINPLTSRGGIEVNQSFQADIDWSEFDWVVVMGGDCDSLLAKLREMDFSFDKLKETAVYIGDSAGAKIQTAFYYNYDKENQEVIFHEGIHPERRRISIVHADNPWFVDEFSRNKVKEFAKENNLKIFKIDENQEIIL